jgi:hypothetical protein
MPANETAAVLFDHTAPTTGALAARLSHTPSGGPGRVVSMALVLGLVTRADANIYRDAAGHVRWFDAIKGRAQMSMRRDDPDYINISRAIDAHRRAHA